MEIAPNPPTTKGPDEMFTGDVWIDAVYTRDSAVAGPGEQRPLQPGARTAWHRTPSTDALRH